MQLEGFLQFVLLNHLSKDHEVNGEFKKGVECGRMEKS